MPDTTTPTATDIENTARTIRTTMLAFAGDDEPLTVREGKLILAMIADLAWLIAEQRPAGGAGPQAGIRFCDEPGCLAMQLGHPGPHNIR
jgi:hypothetical protein